MNLSVSLNVIFAAVLVVIATVTVDRHLSGHRQLLADVVQLEAALGTCMRMAGR